MIDPYSDTVPLIIIGGGTVSGAALGGLIGAVEGTGIAGQTACIGGISGGMLCGIAALAHFLGAHHESFIM